MTEASSVNGEALRRHLDEFGYVVVDNVLTPEFCEDRIAELRLWLKQFKSTPAGFPENSRSVIHSYSVGHLSPVWQVRLAVRSVFAAVWGTEKLLSSVDGISIGRPPEDGVTQFHAPGEHWLHHDQAPYKQGLHCIQGAVYLSPTDEDDWCFRVLEGSHKHFNELMADKPWPGREGLEFRPCKQEDIDFLMKEKGCKLKRIPVNQGGLVLWDSRSCHDNAPPVQNREHKDRWRFVTFVCMGPAAWATERDLQVKKMAYDSLCNTAHWPCREVYVFKKSRINPEYDLKSLPDVALSEQARRLMGVLPYDFNDGSPNGPSLPKYIERKEDMNSEDRGAVDFYGR